MTKTLRQEIKKIIDYEPNLKERDLVILALTATSISEEHPEILGNKFRKDIKELLTGYALLLNILDKSEQID